MGCSMGRLFASACLSLLFAASAGATTWVKAEVWSTTAPALSSGSARAVVLPGAVPHHDGAAVSRLIGDAAVTSVHSFSVGLEADDIEHPVTFDASESVYTFRLSAGATPILSLDMVVHGVAAGRGSIVLSSMGGEALLVVPTRDHQGPTTAFVVHLTAW